MLIRSNRPPLHSSTTFLHFIPFWGAAAFRILTQFRDCLICVRSDLELLSRIIDPTVYPSRELASLFEPNIGCYVKLSDPFCPVAKRTNPGYYQNQCAEDVFWAEKVCELVVSSERVTFWSGLDLGLRGHLQWQRSTSLFPKIRIYVKYYKPQYFQFCETSMFDLAMPETSSMERRHR